MRRLIIGLLFLGSVQLVSAGSPPQPEPIAVGEQGVLGAGTLTADGRLTLKPNAVRSDGPQPQKTSGRDRHGGHIGAHDSRRIVGPMKSGPRRR